MREHFWKLKIDEERKNNEEFWGKKARISHVDFSEEELLRNVPERTSKREILIYYGREKLIMQIVEFNVVLMC
jgi:hypothetical protein